MPSSFSAKRSWNERAGATWRTPSRQRSKGGSSCAKLATSVSLACANAPRSEAASARSSAQARATAAARGLSASSRGDQLVGRLRGRLQPLRRLRGQRGLVGEDPLGVERQMHARPSPRRAPPASGRARRDPAARRGARRARRGPRRAGDPSGSAHRRRPCPRAFRTGRRVARAPRPAAPRPRRPRRRRPRARAPRRRSRT